VNKGESRAGAKAASSTAVSSTTEVSSATTPVARTVEETTVGAAGMVIKVGVAGLEIAWPSAPDHQHCEERRHCRHEDATEDQNPAQRNTRPEGQVNSEGRIGDEKPDEVPHEPLFARFAKCTARVTIV
jgi:hypothetical protein